MLLEAIRNFKVPGANAIYFRREMPHIKGAGGVWDKSKLIYPLLDGKDNNSEHYWTWPTPYKVQFSHLQYEETKYDHQSKEYTCILWDEVTQFTEGQFWFLNGRLRTVSGARTYSRGACNPDPDSFVKKLILPWLDDEGRFPVLSRAGEIYYMVREPQTDEYVWWHLNPKEFQRVYDLKRKENHRYEPISVSFIPASIDDNPHLPEYKAELQNLPFIERQRMLYGDWLIKPSAGNIFRRDWFRFAHRLPHQNEWAELVRYWDLAATEQILEDGRPKNDPDYTAGVLMLRTKQNQFFIVDLVHFRGSPLEVEQRIKATAEADQADYGRVFTRIEADPGQAGKAQVQYYCRLLSGHRIKGESTDRKSKLKRAEPLSAAVENALVSVINAPWAEKLINEMVAFPSKGIHDDIVDAASGAYKVLTENKSGFIRK